MNKKVWLVGALLCCTSIALAGGEKLPAQHTMALQAKTEALGQSAPASNLRDTIDTCPANVLYGQGYADFNGTGAVSHFDQGAIGAGQILFDDFFVEGSIETVSWWGVYYVRDSGGTWSACDQPTKEFQVTILEDSDDPNYFCQLVPQRTYTGIPSYVDSGLTFNSAPILYWTLDLVNDGVTGGAYTPATGFGWLSIQGTQNSDCWFLWMCEDYDDDTAHCLVQDLAEPATCYFSTYDLAFCLNGTAGTLTGACCHEWLESCVDNTKLTDCLSQDDFINFAPIRFAANTPCASLDPLCGDLVGACCTGTTCTQVTRAACYTAGGVFFGATAITGMECDVTMNCQTCAVTCVGTDEGEYALMSGPSGNGYNDTHNAGCNATPNVFQAISCGDDICGTSGVFLDPNTGSAIRDTDWYQITVSNTPGTDLQLDVLSEFPIVVSVRTPSPTTCSEYIDGVSAACSDIIQFSVCLAPGTYYVFIAPASWDEVSVNAEYDLLVSCLTCTPEYGACCVDGACIGDMTSAACVSEGGLGFPGTECATFVCPCSATNIIFNQPYTANWGLMSQRDQGPGDDPDPNTSEWNTWSLDDVVFTAPVTITDMWFYQVESTAGMPYADTGDIMILGDSAGAPNVADMAYVAYNLPLTRAISTENWGGGVYAYHFTSLNIVLEPGTYWFGMRPIFAYSNPGASYWVGTNGTSTGLLYSNYANKPNLIFTANTYGYYLADFCIAGELGEITGACCVGTTCVVLTEAECTAASGVYQGDFVACDANTCAPTICPGDANCDGEVNFFDIDPFVVALTASNNASVWQNWLAANGYASDCDFLNNDTNGDLSVDFFDIDPFVTLLSTGATCP